LNAGIVKHATRDLLTNSTLSTLRLGSAAWFLEVMTGVLLPVSTGRRVCVANLPMVAEAVTVNVSAGADQAGENRALDAQVVGAPLPHASATPGTTTGYRP
jgi:hypothetical protein